MVLDELELPLVLAPMAGGPATPDLAVAVCEAGGLGFLAAGYRRPEDVAAEGAATRARTGRPWGVTVSPPPRGPADPGAGRAYAARLAAEAERAGTELGEPRFDDDGWEAKLDVLTGDPVPVVSFTFGCPPRGVIDRLHVAGSE